MREQDFPPSVPWTTRDVWIGVGLLALLNIVSIAASFLTYFYSLSLDLGLMLSIGELVLLGPVWWLTVRKYGVQWRALGLRGFQGKALGLGCGLLILFYLFNCCYNTFLALLGVSAYDYLLIAFDQTSFPWLLLAGGIVVAPVTEEIFFRGFVFGGLRQRYGWWKAVIISSVAFALLHLNLPAFVPTFILGCIFAYLYHLSESIWPAVSLHSIINAMGLLAVYLLQEFGEL